MATDSARVDAVRQMLGTLARQIGERCPPGLGHWAPAWEHVEKPSRLLLDVAAAYERHEASRDRVLAAARDVRSAWCQAARAFFTRRFCPRCGDRLAEREADGNWCERCLHSMSENARQSERVAR